MAIKIDKSDYLRSKKLNRSFLKVYYIEMYMTIYKTTELLLPIDTWLDVGEWIRWNE